MAAAGAGGGLPPLPPAVPIEDMNYKPPLQDIGLLNKLLNDMITANIYAPEYLFNYFIDMAKIPYYAIQPLVLPSIAPGEKLYINGDELRPEIATTLLKRTTQLTSSIPVDEMNDNIPKSNTSYNEEESFMEGDEANNNSSGNILSFGSYPKNRYVEVSVLEPKPKGQLLYINETIEGAVNAVFSPFATQEYKSNIGNYPIYFIGAFPNQNRHLTLLVFFNGILYSCGVGADNQPKTESEAVFSAGSAGASAAALPSGIAAATGAGAYKVGSTGSAGTAFGRKHVDSVDGVPSFSQNAMLFSPDYLYQGTQTSRIFHMGILLPEHLKALKAQFPIENRRYILNFKNFESGQQFIGFKFMLDKTFALGALPLTRYMNCTVFILNIFGSKIKCGNMLLGQALPDPKQCIITSLREIATAADKYKRVTGEIDVLLNKIIDYIKTHAPSRAGEFFKISGSASDYYARDAYIVYLLARLISNYILTIADPSLINVLIDPRSDVREAPERAAAGGAAAAGMNVDGGRRRLRRKRQTRKRKTKRRATKRRSNI